MTPRSSRVLLVGLLVAFGVGCGAAPATEDAIDDGFLDAGGKADLDIAEGSPEARGVLTVVNSARYRELKLEAGLSPNAAWNIVMHRAGPDERDHTADDDPFDSLAELDAVSFVGTTAFAQLVAYADDLGLIVHGPTGSLLERIQALDGMFPEGRGAGQSRLVLEGQLEPRLVPSVGERGFDLEPLIGETHRSSIMTCRCRR